MHNPLLVQVAHARHELGEQPARSIVLQVSVVENVVEQFTSGGVLEHDAIVPLGLLHLVQLDNVGVGELLEDGDLAHDLGHAGRVAAQLVLLDELDGDLEHTAEALVSRALLVV